MLHLWALRVYLDTASTYGTVAPRGLGRSPMVSRGSSFGPLGATVPPVEAFLFVFCLSRRQDARNGSTDGTVSHRGLGRSLVACRGSSLGPPGSHRAIGGSAWGPPYRRWKRYPIAHGAGKGVASISSLIPVSELPGQIRKVPDTQNKT